jgi:hypothetical protein
MAASQTATSGSNDWLPASEAANSLSERARVTNDAHFVGLLAHKTTTMRRTTRLQIRPVQAFSAQFLRAMIGE